MMMLMETREHIETMDNFYDPKCGVFSFLEQIGLHQYYEMFLAKGFDSEKDLQFMEWKDLDTMCITDKKHRDLIISQASLYRPSEEQELYEWLRENMLEYYYINFLQSGRDRLDIVRQMALPDDDIYDDLEIMLPGHRKRLERAVLRLQKRSQPSNNVECPVAYGKWMKPDYLEFAKFDFLCIDGTISSTKNTGKKEEIVFMVDSGSDVVTLRPEIVQRLNLVKKCTVRSQGVHVAKEKTLYEARLKIGYVELKIELIAEEYNSLGSRVFRHFRHYISGSRHVWLKGDFKDPSMEINATEQDYKKQQKTDEQIHTDSSATLELEQEVETELETKNGGHEIETQRSESNVIAAEKDFPNIQVEEKERKVGRIQDDDVGTEQLHRPKEGEGENKEKIKADKIELMETSLLKADDEIKKQNGTNCFQIDKPGAAKCGEEKEKEKTTEFLQNGDPDLVKGEEKRKKEKGSAIFQNGEPGEVKLGEERKSEERTDNFQNGRLELAETRIEKAKEEERTEDFQNDEINRHAVKKGPVKHAGLKEKRLPTIPVNQDVPLPVKIASKHCFFSRKRSRGPMTYYLNKKPRGKPQCNDKMSLYI